MFCCVDVQMVAPSGYPILFWPLTSRPVVGIPYGVQRVYLQARHRVLPTTSVTPSSRPRLHATIPFQPSVVQPLLSASNLGSSSLPVDVQPYASVVDVSYLNKHCPWPLRFLECVAATTTYFGACGWHLDATCGILDRVLALHPTRPAQIMSSIINPVSIQWQMVSSTSSASASW
jgi:hypothetical protein